MGPSGGDGRRAIERGHKTESYIHAIEGNSLSSEPPKPSALPPPHPPSERLLPTSPPEVPYTGRNLAYYRDKPFWRRLRWCLAILCCLLFLLLLFILLYLIFLSPKCTPVYPRWWSGAVIYQLWVPSFQDSSSDGNGDYKGVSRHLSYLKKLGVDIVYPRPFLLTEPSGIGVLEFKNADNDAGGFEQARLLIAAVHRAGLKIMIDLPLVATSSSHEWFQRSAKGSLAENAQYSSYYYWKRNVQPSAFVSTYRNSSILYFHVKDRPDLPILNWRVEGVSKEVKNALSFWIDQGIDGFNLGNVEHLARSLDGKQADWPEVAKILRQVRRHVNEYAADSVGAEGKEILLIASPEPIKEEHKQLLQEDADFDAIVNTELTRVATNNDICYKSDSSVAGCFNEILSDLLLFHTYSGVKPVWLLSDAGVSRVTTRVRSRVQSELISIVQLTLPGLVTIYYGDEIGLEDTGNFAYPQRGVMQWDDTENAGFSSIAPNTSSGPNADYSSINVAVQSGRDRSQFKTISTLTALRHSKDVLVNGETYIGKIANRAFALIRFPSLNNATTDCQESVLVVVNFASLPQLVTLADLPPITEQRSLPWARVIVASSRATTFAVGDAVDLSPREIRLGPEEAFVLSFTT